MTLFWKIGISLALLGGLSGGLLWYVRTNQAETVFESAPEEKQNEIAEPAAQSPEVELQQALVTEGQGQEVSSKEIETKPIKEEANTENEETEEPSSAKATEGLEPKNFAIKSALVSFGHESASGRKIDTVVLHSSYNPNGDPYSVNAVRGIWQSYGVAPHYMVARDGTVYQLVADKDIAYHAGESTMKDGRKNVNDFSIGVEILNTKDDEYTKAQYQAVKDLIAYLKGKHSIKYVVGHDDIAPGRKTDPWNFNWSKL